MRADERTDIWALGVLLYEMVTGRLPFEADNVAAAMDRVAKANYPAPSRINAALPREIDDIVGQCLKAKPDQRYQSAEALLRDVRAASEPAPSVSSWSLSRLRPSGEMRAAARRRLPAVASMSAAAITFAFLMYALFSPGSPNVVVEDTPAISSGPLGGTSDTPSTSASATAGRVVREIVLTLGEGTADVFADTGHVGRTPHTVKAALGDRVSLVLRRNGYEDEIVNFVVTEALSPRFTYYLRPRLSPPNPGDGSAPDAFSLRVVPGALHLALGPTHG